MLCLWLVCRFHHCSDCSNSNLWILNLSFRKVTSWYVTCPLHASHRSCTKSMSESNGLTGDLVVRRLLYWIAQGSLVQTPYQPTNRGTLFTWVVISDSILNTNRLVLVSMKNNSYCFFLVREFGARATFGTDRCVRFHFGTGASWDEWAIATATSSINCTLSLDSELDIFKVQPTA